MPVPKDGCRKIFISYSHKDRDWLERLQVHLKPLERDGLFEFWDDTRIRTGDEWRKEIKDALNSAAAAVLLISADFIASDFIAAEELPPLLAAVEKEGVKILPLILSPSRFENIKSLSRFQSVNPPSKPLIKLEKGEQEEYLLKLSDDVLRAVKDAQTKPARAERTRIFSVPLPQNKFFTGRGDILNALHTGFASGERIQALNGLGGIGKTQTALEYAYRRRQDYQVVLWASANSRESLITDFAAMATLLGLPEKDAQDQSEAVGAVKRWLENNSSWLLILDNADEILMAQEFIPSSQTGHILLTSRAHNMGVIAAGNPLEKMTSTEGALFLLRRLRKIEKDKSLDTAADESRAQAESLSNAVDGLPLALDQAAAFIEEKPSTLMEYQALYQSERKELLKRRGKLAKDHPSVTATFSLAFKKVGDDNPAAADLLRLCAFLEADSIPEEIFSGGAKELGETLGPVAESPLGLSDAIEEAARFSLLRRHPEDRTLSLHQLAHAVLRDEMDDGPRRVWAERAVRAVNEVFPDVEYSNWPSCDRLIRHAQALATLIDEYGFDFPEAARLLNQAGYYLNLRAQYAEAEPLLAQALDIRESALGAEHPDVAHSLNSLAWLYDDQGKYGEAEPLYVRALAIREKALGAEHPNVANSLNNLALLYRNQGKYAEAEPLYRRALAIYEKALGAEHPSVATSINNLALLSHNQGKYAEAEPLHRRALAIREKALGAEHLDVANSLNNLALLYHDQGKFADAEPLYVRALAIREKALGAEHPNVANSLNNLAGLYDKRGEYAEAEPLYLRALAIREKSLGAEHPDVAISLNSLAGLYENQGKYAEAEPLYERALAIREKALGAEHPSVATSLNDLAGLYDNQEKYAEAEMLYERALAIYERSLGAEHPHVATVLKNHASLLRAMDKESEAEKLEARASTIREKYLST
jgi:tetratricopeptide (TPR) repeat protein